MRLFSILVAVLVLAIGLLAWQVGTAQRAPGSAAALPGGVAAGSPAASVPGSTLELPADEEAAPVDQRVAVAPEVADSPAAGTVAIPPPTADEEPEAEQLSAVATLEVRLTDRAGRPLENCHVGLRCTLVEGERLWSLDRDEFPLRFGLAPGPIVGVEPPLGPEHARRLDAGSRVTSRSRAGSVTLVPADGEPGVLRTFLFGAVPIEGWLRISGHGLVETVHEVSLEEGPNVLRLVIPSAPVFRGRIVRENGEAVGMATLSIRSQPGLPEDLRTREDSVSLSTDEWGAFEVSVPVEGPVSAYVWAGQVGRSRLIEMTARPDAVHDLGQIVLGGVGEVRARLVLMDGTPVAGRIVDLRSTELPPAVAPLHRVTDSAGRIEFRHLLEGNYELRVRSLVGEIAPLTVTALPSRLEERLVLDAALVTFDFGVPEGRKLSPWVELTFTDDGGNASTVDFDRRHVDVLIPAGRALDVVGVDEHGGRLVGRLPALPSRSYELGLEWVGE